MTIHKNRSLPFALLMSLATIATAAAGCSASDDEMVNPRLDVINKTKSALSAASITSITGTYGSDCDGRSALGTDPWTLTISGGAAGDELSVRKNDSNCVLTVKSIVTADGPYIGSPSIALNTSDAWKATASAFALSGEPLAFYGNAKISALTFGANFTVTLLVSDAPSASDEGSKGAEFATQSGSVSAGTVPASDYTVSFASFSISKDVNNVVQSVAGYAQLAEASVTGQDYAIHEGALTGSSTVEEIETAWAGASTTGLLSALTTLQLPASGFGLAAVDLDTNPQRTVIIRNTSEGVPSYQLLLITFVP